MRVVKICLGAVLFLFSSVAIGRVLPPPLDKTLPDAQKSIDGTCAITSTGGQTDLYALNETAGTTGFNTNTFNALRGTPVNSAGAAMGSPSSPPSLLPAPPPDKALWYKANDGVNVTTGQYVTSWLDQSGNGINADDERSDERPVLENEAINFNEAIRFDGNNDRLSGDEGFYTHDYFVVFKSDRDIDEDSEGQAVIIGDGLAADSLDLSGFALGSVTKAFDNEVLTHGVGNHRRYRECVRHPASYPSAPYIFNAKDDTSPSLLTRRSELYMNGRWLAHSSLDTIYGSIDNKNFSIGQFLNEELFFDGLIAEIIVYEERQSDENRRRIASYLAIKYGITLDQSAPVDEDKTYITADDTIVWDPDDAGTYNHDIAGIGRDDVTPLDQPKSKSENSDALITMEDPATTHGQFLMWSNNDDGLSSWGTTEIPETGYQRLQREWFVEENNGDVGTVTVYVEETDLPAVTGTVVLMVDNDGDFSSGVTTVSMANVAGVWQVDYNFNDETYFTVGQLEYDYGDAPDPGYPTLQINDGARHRLLGAYRLGTAIDSETDGQPSADAGGEGADDDGISFTTLVEGGTTGTIRVNVTTTGGYLNGWIDYNGDGNWDDPEEHAFSDVNITSASQNINYDIPCGVADGTTFARFRYSSNQGLSYDGEATDGEVEDYQITLVVNSNAPVFTALDGGVCSLQTGVQYAITGISGATYSWSVTGGTITSAINQYEIMVDWGGASQSPGQVNCDVTVPIGVGDTCFYNLLAAVVITDPATVETNNDTIICAGDSVDLWVNDNDYSLDFIRTPGRVHVPNDDVVNTANAYPERSISVWFKVDDKDLSGKQVIYEEGGGTSGFCIYIDSGTLYIIGYTSGSVWGPVSAISTSAISNNTWHNAAFSYYYGSGPDYFKTYLDGNLIGQVTPTEMMGRHNGNVRLAFCGGARFHDGPGGGGQYFRGILDEFKLWNDALTDAEITQNITPMYIDSELDLYYNFNERTGNILIDQIGDLDATIFSINWDDDDPVPSSATWSNSTGIIGTTDTITVAPDTTTTYTVTLDGPGGECTAMGSVTVTVNDIDVTLDTSDGRTVYCEGETITFIATPDPSSSGIIYTFSVNGGQVQQGTGNTWSTNTLVNGDEVIVEAVDTNGCSDISDPIILEIHANTGTNPIRIIR